MAFKRMVKEVYVCFGAVCRPGDYECGYEYPIVHTIEAGNPPGSQVVDARCEFEPFQPAPRNILLPFVDVLDDNHVSLACKVIEDVTNERVKVRIILIVAL